MFYRWIVIENSLKDKNVLKKYKLLSETVFANDDPIRKSRMLKIQVPENKINSLIENLKDVIIYPFYTHFYHEDPKINKLIIVFSGKRIDTKKDNFQKVVDYGMAHGVIRDEMNISPRDISQEDW